MNSIPKQKKKSVFFLFPDRQGSLLLILLLSDVFLRAAAERNRKEI